MSNMETENLTEESIDDDGDLIQFTINKTQLIWIFSIISLGIGLLSGYFIWGQGENSNIISVQADSIQPTQQNVQVQQEQTADKQIVRYDVPIDDDPSLGSETAPITIVEFSDFECPFCTKFHIETFSKLMDVYGDQILFVYRDFPLTSIHAEAFPAAEAANCSGDQGKYWEYHDKLFLGGPENLNAANYIQYGEELNLDMDEFQECVNSRRFQEEVQGDLDFALNLGINSTPTFFVNGIPLVGAQPFEMFSQLIESELAGEIP